MRTRYRRKVRSYSQINYQREEADANSPCHSLRARSRGNPSWWQVQDSNLRRHTPTDLQSASIGRSDNLPLLRHHVG